MLTPTVILITALVSASIGWELKTQYLRYLHRMSIRIRRVQQGGRMRR